MKARILVVALLVVLHQGFFANAAVACPGAADSSCSAFSTLEILVTAGKCSGTASADCRAVTESSSVFKEAFEEWWGEEGVCDSGKAEVAVTSIATAVAKVWSNAAVKVNCDGLGFACGWSISNGNAFALAFAEAIAQAAAEAGASTDANGFCFADVRAVAGVFAEAAASAQADTCTIGGAAVDFENSYVEAVQKGIATAFARATASACGVDGEVSAASECSGEAESSTEGGVTKSGDVCGGIRQLKACTGVVKDKCCSSDFRRSLCTCRGCNGPWFRKTNAGDAKKSFANRDGDLCFCLDTADEGIEEESEESTEEENEPQTTAPVETPIDPPAEPETPEIIAAPVEVSEITAAPKTPETVPEVVPESTDSDLEEEATPLEEGQVLEAKANIICTGAVDTTCSAFSTLEILVTAGSCSGTASADCTAVTESTSEFKEAFDEWWNDDGTCDSGKAEAAATAVAKAIAKVWANASVKVTCEGMGFACGWSISDGQAWAVAFAEAVAQASAEAGSGNAEGFCFADIRALSSVIAEAAAKAQSDACTTGGSVEDFETSYASAIQIGIARAFAQATAEACSADGELIASSECSGEAESTTGKGESFALGDACAGTAQIKACTGPGMEMCCDAGFKRTLCNCNRKGCAAGPWVKKTDFNADKNTLRSFEDRKRNVCFCMGNY